MNTPSYGPILLGDGSRPLAAMSGLIALGLFSCSLPPCPQSWVRGDGNLCLAEETNPWGADGVFRGDLRIEDSEGLTGFCEMGHSVEGNLRVVGVEATSLELLSCLEEVSGSLRVESNLHLTELELPELRAVGGTLLVGGNDHLPAVYLKALEQVGESLSVEYNQELSSVLFPSLKEVGVSVFLYQNSPIDSPNPSGAWPLGSFPAEKGTVGFPELNRVGEKFWVRLNNAIRWVDAPHITSVGDLVKITGNESLETVNLSSLPEAHSLWISFNASLSSLALDAIRSITYSVTVLQTGLDHLSFARAVQLGELQLTGNSRLPTVSMPHLAKIESNLTITQNTALTELGLPALSSVGGNLQILENSVLHDLEVDRFLEQLGEANIGGEVDVGDNGGD